MIPTTEERGAPEASVAKVSLSIPCRAEYVAIARLALLGVANRLNYSYDEVEDVRLAVGEACTHAVERAYQAAGTGGEEPTLWIDSMITPEGLSIDVRDNVPAGESVSVSVSESGGAPASEADEADFDKQDLGALLMEILVDSVSVEPTPTGTVVHLYKQAPAPAASGE